MMKSSIAPGRNCWGVEAVSGGLPTIGNQPKTSFMIINTEKVFGEVILAAGGRRLDEELRGKADFKNADYLFEQHNCVGELKRIQKFLDEDPDFRRKLSKHYSKWTSQGRVPPAPPGTRLVEFNLTSVPRDCAEEVMGLLRKQLMSAYLEKANRQLRETKKHFDWPDAYGIVFLAVEGTSWYDPHGLMSVLARIPKGKLEAIDAFVVFNGNFNARHPRATSSGGFLDIYAIQQPPASR